MAIKKIKIGNTTYDIGTSVPGGNSGADNEYTVSYQGDEANGAFGYLHEKESEMPEEFPGTDVPKALIDKADAALYNEHYIDNKRGQQVTKESMPAHSWDAVAFGAENKTKADESQVFGRQNEITGEGATNTLVMGFKNVIESVASPTEVQERNYHNGSDNSLIGGSNNAVIGVQSSLIFGKDNKASGDAITVFGAGNFVGSKSDPKVAAMSVTAGAGNGNYGTAATALGYQNYIESNANNSAVIGQGLIAQNPNEIVVGMYNKCHDYSPNATNSQYQKKAFVIGIGTSPLEKNRKNALSISYPQANGYCNFDAANCDGEFHNLTVGDITIKGDINILKSKSESDAWTEDLYYIVAGNDEHNSAFNLQWTPAVGCYTCGTLSLKSNASVGIGILTIHMYDLALPYSSGNWIQKGTVLNFVSPSRGGRNILNILENETISGVSLQTYHYGNKDGKWRVANGNPPEVGYHIWKVTFDCRKGKHQTIGEFTNSANALFFYDPVKLDNYTRTGKLTSGASSSTQFYCPNIHYQKIVKL